MILANNKKYNLFWLGHSGFKIKIGEKVIYIDPYKINDSEIVDKADIILITHSHFDHLSQEDIQKIVKPGSKIICTPDCQSKITRINEKIDLFLSEPGKEFVIDEIKIKAIEAYNERKKFHPKNEYWVGYVIQFENLIIYHAGDTDKIKEMEKLTGYSKKDNQFIILLPVGGNFTMNAEEAASAASLIKPTLAIPMHYGTIVGSRTDAENFVRLCEEKGTKAEILEKGK